MHIDQKKKGRLGRYAMASGAAAATITVVEKIIEWLPFIIGHSTNSETWNADVRHLLSRGDFRAVYRSLSSVGRSLPPRLQPGAKRQMINFHALQPRLDRMSDEQRKALGEEIIRRLDAKD